MRLGSTLQMTLVTRLSIYQNSINLKHNYSEPVGFYSLYKTRDACLMNFLKMLALRNENLLEFFMKDFSFLLSVIVYLKVSSSEVWALEKFHVSERETQSNFSITSQRRVKNS